MASEADTRHGSLGILLAQARAEKITCKTTNWFEAFSNPSIDSRRNLRDLVRISKTPSLDTDLPGASPPETEVTGGEAAVGSRPTSACVTQTDVA